MKLKELLVKILTETATGDEKKLFMERLENDDELASVIVEYDIPLFIEWMCNNEFISKKEYMQKYRWVAPLYTKEITVSDCLFLFKDKLEQHIVPYLSVSMLGAFIDECNARRKVIETLQKDVERLEEFIRKSHEVKPGDGEKKSSGKGKGKSKTQIKREQFEEERSIKLSQIAQLNSWFANPEAMRVMFTEEKNRAKTEIQSRTDFLISHPMFSSAAAPVSGNAENAVVAELQATIESLLGKIDGLEKDKKDLKTFMDRLSVEKQALKTELLEQKQRVAKLSTDKEALELKLESLQRESERMTAEISRLQAQIAEYHKILMQLNGRIIEAISDPITLLEQIVFKIKDPSNKLTPQHIAVFVEEPICQSSHEFDK